VCGIIIVNKLSKTGQIMNINANFLNGIFRNKNRNILTGNEKIVRSKPVLSLKNLFKRKKSDNSEK
jgi:hypothetical protein